MWRHETWKFGRFGLKSLPEDPVRNFSRYSPKYSRWENRFELAKKKRRHCLATFFHFLRNKSARNRLITSRFGEGRRLSKWNSRSQQSEASFKRDLRKKPSTFNSRNLKSIFPTKSKRSRATSNFPAHWRLQSRSSLHFYSPLFFNSQNNRRLPNNSRLSKLWKWFAEAGRVSPRIWGSQVRRKFSVMHGNGAEVNALANWLTVLFWYLIF